MENENEHEEERWLTKNSSFSYYRRILRRPHRCQS